MTDDTELPRMTLVSDMRIMLPNNEYHSQPKIPGRVRVLSLPREMFDSTSERQAQRNHDQTLARLNERGGLDAAEAIAVLACHAWVDIPIEYAHRVLYAMRASFNRGQLLVSQKS